MQSLSRVTNKFQSRLLEQIKSISEDYEKTQNLIIKDEFSNHELARSEIENIDIKADIDALKKLDVIKNVKGDVQARESDEKNCKIIYNALDRLTPQDASDVRIWTYLTLFICLKYSKNRWDYKSSNTDRWLKERFIPTSPQVIKYRNSLGSLWWAGYLLKRKSVAEDYSFDNACKIFFRTTDLPSLIIGYPELLSFEKIFAGVIRLIDKEVDFTTAKTSLLTNAAIKKINNDSSYKPKSEDYKNKSRQFFINLNVACNGFNVHMMDKKELDSFFKSIYDNP